MPATSITEEVAGIVAKNACLNIRDIAEIILHSDLGSQYMSQVFENYLCGKFVILLVARGIHMTMSVSNHFMLKKKKIYLHTYKDSTKAHKAIFNIYITGITLRIHSAISYLTSQ